MNLKFCLILVFLSDIEPSYLYDTHLIEVPLDHFSFIENKTFKLRYLLNGHYHVKGGPVFFYTGNEGDITSFADNSGFLFDIAPLFNALIVFAEHRYYGKSLPFGNKTFDSLENLKYLTTSQALADFVYLIEDLKNAYLGSMISKDTYPFVAFGGSYGGMLAAWLRMKYPNSVIGAIAASAPIWYFSDLTPCDKFYELVTNVFDKFGTTECSKSIRTSWIDIRNITKTNKGKEYLSKLWKLCHVLTTSDDVDKLIGWLSNIYVNLVMLNYPYPTNFLAPVPAYPVKVFCDKFISLNINLTQDILGGLGQALEMYTNYTRRTKCNDINVTTEEFDEKVWDYQACTQMVMPVCSTDKDMFETQRWDIEKFSQTCFKRFGTRSWTPNWPVLEYGGKNLKYFSNIVFSNGMMDPWSCGGVLQNVSKTIWAVNITDGAHHVDLRGADNADTNYVIEARKLHVKAIKMWLDIS